MTIKVEFDCATLADAVQKASRVAPVKGNAYDKAAGIAFVFRHPSDVIIIKSTDLDTSYTQRMNVQNLTATADFTWRIPSAILAGLISALPMESGSIVTFIDQGDGAIRITCGNLVTKLNMITGEYPEVRTFPTHGMLEANDFAQKVQQVAWATLKDSSILSGIHIDGERLIACNRMNAAIVPCKVPVEKPITVPLFALLHILNKATDVKVAAVEQKFQMQLDAESQATANIFEGDYPNIMGLIRDNFTIEFKVKKAEFVETVQRMLVVARVERMPQMKMTLSSLGLMPSLALDIDVKDTGRIMDMIQVNTDFDDSFDIWFKPDLIVDAIANCKDDTALVQMGHPEPAKAPLAIVRVSDTSGYQAIVAPWKVN